MSQLTFSEVPLLSWTPGLSLAPLVWFVLIQEKCLVPPCVPPILLALI